MKLFDKHLVCEFVRAICPCVVFRCVMIAFLLFSLVRDFDARMVRLDKLVFDICAALSVRGACGPRPSAPLRSARGHWTI